MLAWMDALSEAAREVQEGLFEVVVGLCRNVIVLKVLLPVEGDGLVLDFAVLDIDLVSDEHNWDMLAIIVADADEIAVPVRHRLVGDP